MTTPSANSNIPNRLGVNSNDEVVSVSALANVISLDNTTPRTVTESEHLGN